MDPSDHASRILLIGGSLRAGSVNGAILETARTLIPAGVTASFYRGMSDLPHFSPDDDRDPLPLPVADLRAQLERSHAVLFSTPEYAGALPGSFKNLLDWTVGGGIYGKPVGWINGSAAPGGARGAYTELRTVLGYTGSDIVEAACVQIPVTRSRIGADGVIHEPEIQTVIGQALAALAERIATARRADDSVAAEH